MSNNITMPDDIIKMRCCKTYYRIATLLFECGKDYDLLFKSKVNDHTYYTFGYTDTTGIYRTTMIFDYEADVYFESHSEMRKRKLDQLLNNNLTNNY